MNRGFFAKFLAVILIIILMTPAFALAESFKAKVYTDTMKVYTSKSTSSKVVDTLKKNAAFTVVSANSTWAEIKYGSKKGYALVKCMIKTSGKQKVYTKNVSYVYRVASGGSKKLSKLTENYPLYIVGESGNYYLVEDANKKFTGYIPKSYVSTSKTTKWEVSSSSKISYKSSSGGTTTCPSAAKSTQSYTASTLDISKSRAYICYVAECKLGCKYVNAGPNNSTNFSNYSFVKTVMKVLGYSIPDSIKGVGNVSDANKIKMNSLKAGDIVCFDCDAFDNVKVDHIGIYLGSGYFIHASATAGCVVVSSLNTNYYKKAFCWGRRVIK